MAQVPLDFRDLPKPPPDLRASDFLIGLALSGGGYRAAAFHLGTLAYLHRVGMLHQLSRLSTVSGGTFTGASYILSLVEGKAFADFFRGFYGFLCRAQLITDGLDGLGKGTVRVPSGEQKLITAIANVYDRTFLKTSSGKPYTLGQIIDSKISVQEVVFNATEFRNGIAFRFQKSASPQARIGNGKISILKEDAKLIRIADIVAASSCFPGGFEPLAFPGDFVWPDNEVPDTVQTAVEKRLPGDKTIAIMDGGIYDNQGISSLLLSDDRKKSEPLGMFIISDVDVPNDNLFPYPQKTRSSGKLTLGQLYGLLWLFFIICGLTLVAVGYDLWREIVEGTFSFWQDFFSAFMPVVLVGLVIATLVVGRRLIRDHLLKNIPQVGVGAWKRLRKLKIDDFIYIMKLRIESLLALTRSVFMDRIKALIFRQVYEDKRYQGKRISNRIDRLIDRPLKVPGASSISKDLEKKVRGAVKMPTTLWFDANPDKKREQMESLVVTGQATICFNLMQYIVRRYGEDLDEYPEVHKLWVELQNDWQQLNKYPVSLLDELLKTPC
ncbi:MAG: patatin-like phospholipase family protein [Cyanobacteria bacterium J06656_5]